MAARRRKVVVIGAGIIGLSTAVVIAENLRNVDVHVVADQMTPNTTSDGAGGLWAPQFGHALKKGSNTEQRLRDWATHTWHHTFSLARGLDAHLAGVSLIPVYKVFYWTENQDNHWWQDVVLDYRRLSDSEKTQLFPGVRDGFVFTGTVTDCTFYLPYLMERLRKAGGSIWQKKISSFYELADQCDVVVNCSGLGAATLANDDDLNPIRGQTIQVEAPWIHYALEVEPELSASQFRLYFIPKRNVVVVGGTQQVHNPNSSSNQADIDAIFKRIYPFMPSLKNATIKRHWAGLRPNREAGVRLEKETITNGRQRMQIVHNYGHSGNGITLHWGCALQAADIVKEIMESGTEASSSKL